MADHARLREAYEEAVRQTETIDAGREASYGSCSNCRFGICTEVLVAFPDDYKCVHPLMAKRKYDPTDDKVVVDAPTQKSARGPNALCGPEGKLFTPKLPQQRLGFWIGSFVLGFIFFITIIAETMP